MSERNNRPRRRKAQGGNGTLARYQRWLAGLSKGQRVRYRVLQTATVISLIIVIAFLVLRLWIKVPELPDFNAGQTGNTSGTTSFEGSETPDIARSGRKDGVYTFLLVGKDTAGGGNTDTMLLLTYNTREKTISGLNLPRDTMMNVDTASKRLNAVYNYNKGKDKTLQVKKGMAALKKEVAHLTGISPDFYVIVEWEAIRELVDALGGVEFEVPFNMDYDDPTPGQDLHIHQKAGLRMLTGDDAMQVIRHRKNNDGSHSNGDVGRLKIQQDFLKAVAKKCLQPTTFLKIPELAKIFTENVTTDLSVGNILAFAEQARGMQPDEDVTFVTAPIGASFLYRGAALITLDETKLLAQLNESMNPYLRDIDAEDLQLVYRKSNGTFSVTNGTLADAKMGQVQSTNKKDPENQEPQKGGDTAQRPDGSGGGTTTPPSHVTPDGDTSQGGDTAQQPDGSGGGTTTSPDGSHPAGGGATSQPGGDTSQNGGSPGTIDPDQVLPDPNAGVSQDAGGIDATGNPVAVLPSRPQPLDQAA